MGFWARLFGEESEVRAKIYRDKNGQLRFKIGALQPDGRFNCVAVSSIEDRYETEEDVVETLKEISNMEIEMPEG